MRPLDADLARLDHEPEEDSGAVADDQGPAAQSLALLRREHLEHRDQLRRHGRERGRAARLDVAHDDPSGARLELEPFAGKAEEASATLLADLAERDLAVALEGQRRDVHAGSVAASGSAGKCSTRTSSADVIAAASLVSARPITRRWIWLAPS